MAKNKSKFSFRNKIAILALILLLVGIVFAISEAQKRQNIQQEASKLRPSSSTQSFESTFGGWVPDYYLYNESSPSKLLGWKIARSTNQAYRGKHSLMGYLNGLNADGTIWMEREFSVKPNSFITVNIDFYLWSQTTSELNSWPVVAYAGLSDPEEENSFSVIGKTDTSPGWKEYTYSKTFQTDSTGKAWAAFGFGATSEYTRTYYMDFVKLKTTPLGNGNEEKLCGGIAGVKCPTGYSCKLSGNYPDASGQCIKEEAVFCAQDVKQCPDGSYVSRTGPKCGFAPCPITPQYCGGIAGIKCPTGYSCKLDGNYPDAGGQCVKDAVVCANDVKQCPDGSYVSRTGPKCGFAPCPITTN